MSLHIGTSGWAYPEWKPGFYPADVPRARFLAHYASVLSGCEINATCYRLQRESTMAGWAEQMCGGKTHIGEDQLAQALEARGKRAHAKAGAGTLRRVAHQVAADYSLKCAHLEVGKGLTFD